VVAQVKSNRVVYFTDDPEYTPPVEEDWYYLSSYQGELPKSMTLRNCWRWRFNGGVFKDTRPARPAKTPPERLLDHNRKALLKILREKVDAVRIQYAASCRMGAEVRKDKLREARDFLDGARERAYPFLEAIAAARDVPLADAARLVAERDKAIRSMLVETEQIRERFKVAIHQAHTAEALQAIRERLLGDIYPHLSDRFATRFIRTEPFDRHRPLPEPTLLHERNRLRAQVKMAINGMRAPYAPGYALDEHAVARKVASARRTLESPVEQAEGADPLLENYARANGMTLREAARRLLDQHERAEMVLLESEALKDALLAEIEKAQTEHDIGLISMKLKSAAAASPPGQPG
jgi:hypothetical protein